jgi:hypothetical protein
MIINKIEKLEDSHKKEADAMNEKFDYIESKIDNYSEHSKS